MKSTLDLLPCPQCGSTKTLSKLRIKREVVWDRCTELQKRRYPELLSPLPTKSRTSGSKISMEQIAGCSPSHIGLAANLNESSSNDLVISTPSSTNPVLAGTVVINGAALDVCMKCGTLYAANVTQLQEQIESEIAEMDPLGALAEIRQSIEDCVG